MMLDLSGSQTILYDCSPPPSRDLFLSDILSAKYTLGMEKNKN